MIAARAATGVVFEPSGLPPSGRFRFPEEAWAENWDEWRAQARTRVLALDDVAPMVAQQLVEFGRDAAEEEDSAEEVLIQLGRGSSAGLAAAGVSLAAPSGAKPALRS